VAIQRARVAVASINVGSSRVGGSSPLLPITMRALRWVRFFHAEKFRGGQKGAAHKHSIMQTKLRAVNDLRERRSYNLSD